MTEREESRNNIEEKIVRDAMKELGLAYDPDRPRSKEDFGGEKRSLAEVALEQFRSEYTKRVRASVAD